MSYRLRGNGLCYGKTTRLSAKTEELQGFSQRHQPHACSHLCTAMETGGGRIIRLCPVFASHAVDCIAHVTNAADALLAALRR